MQIHFNANLKHYHTFGIDQHCQVLVEVNTIAELIDVFRHPEWQQLPKMMLGQGSNVLFTTFYAGVVIINRLMGIEISEDEDSYRFDVKGGEDWPNLVEKTIEQGIAGLENLAMIPGCAGSAPIQNIGAYGIEFKDVCDYVDYLCLETYQTIRVYKNDCQFGYRTSIFKHHLYQQAIVVGIGLVLPKNWVPHIAYGPLKSLSQDCTPQDVFQRVCEIRKQKLPDPALKGNAGSFFKNPVVLPVQFEALKLQFPEIVGYPTEEGVKIAAGWLIDHCGLRGYQIGGAQVHKEQALVLINQTNATAEDVIQLAEHIYQCVDNAYSIALAHEVRFIGSKGEVYLQDLREEGAR